MGSAGGTGSARRARERHAAHYAQTLKALDAAYRQRGVSVATTLSEFQEALPNIRRGQRWAAAAWRTDDTAAVLCSRYALWGAHVLEAWQPPRERLVWLRQALRAARCRDVESDIGEHLGNLGGVYLDLGRYERARALCERHLTWVRRLGDRRAECHALNNLGVVLSHLDAPNEALERLHAALALSEGIDEELGIGTALGNLGAAYRETGDVVQALAYARRHAEHVGWVGDRRGEAIAHQNLATLADEQDGVDEALEHYTRALALAREVSDRRIEGAVLASLARHAHHAGDSVRARHCAEHALAAASGANDLDTLAHAHVTLGHLDTDAQRRDDADGHFREALACYRRLSDDGGAVDCLTNLGSLHLAERRLVPARRWLDDALAGARRLDDARALFDVLEAYGRLCTR